MIMMRLRVDADDKIERKILVCFLSEGQAITSTFLLVKCFHSSRTDSTFHTTSSQF